jgi:hypothetical protein
MPFARITRNVDFTHGPHAGMPVTVHFPATFKPAEPFVVCVFLHGISLKNVPFENHIQMAVAQMEHTSTNNVLLSPRFGAGAAAGTFGNKRGFSSFISELNSVLPSLLAAAGLSPTDASRIASRAVATAPIVLVSFSGGWRPLNAILNGLLSLDEKDELVKDTDCTRRLVGIALLDSLFSNKSSLYEHTSSGILSWQAKRRTQTALLSIYGRRTTLGAPRANARLACDLEATGPVDQPASWDELHDFTPSRVAFLKVDTKHLRIPTDGPPKSPIAAFLTLLADRLTQSSGGSVA